MANNRIRENSEDKAHWYTNDQVTLAGHPFYRRTTNRRLDFIKGCIEEYAHTIGRRGEGPLTILDAGCGDGVILKMLDVQGYPRIIGCEYNFIRARRARDTHAGALIINATLTGCPFRERAFNIIVMNQVLEHIDDDVSVLSQIKRILKDDGILIIGVPNEGCLLGKIRNRLIQPWIEEQTDHRNFYTESAISLKLSNVGFQIIRLRRDGFIFPYSKAGDLLASSGIGFALLTLLGRIFRSQCGGLYFVCKKEDNK